MDYNAQLLPANAFYNMTNLDHNKLQGDKNKLIGPVTVYETLLACVGMLFAYTPTSLDKFTIEEWHKFLYRIYFGVIKETEDFGTTSVSQGVAEYRFRKLEMEAPEIMGFINNGTGASKFQVCKVRTLTKDIDIVHMLFECKGTGEEPSLNSMRIGSFIPKNEIAKDEQTKRLNKSLDMLRNELKLKGLPLKIVLSAFITGPLRLHFEQNKLEQEIMEKEVHEFFQSHEFDKDEVSIVPWNHESYFMTQTQESEMECLAAESLYSNLAKANLIDKNIVVFETWGVGRGSCQMGKFLVPLGMDSSIEFKANIPAHYLKELKDGLANDLYARFKNLPESANLVIALKSGFAMLLENKQNQWVIQSIRNAETVELHVVPTDKNKKIIKDIGKEIASIAAIMEHAQMRLVKIEKELATM